MNSKSKSDNLWEKIQVDENLVGNTLKLANRDLKTAENVFNDNDYDWAFAISYNAMLQAGRALMFSEGFRPKGAYKHVSVVEFVKTKFGKKFADNILFMFDKIRKKRHTAVYEQVNIISREEAENAIKTAKEFVAKINELLENKKPGNNGKGAENEKGQKVE